MSEFWFRKFGHALLKIANRISGYKIWEKDKIPEVIL